MLILVDSVFSWDYRRNKEPYMEPMSPLLSGVEGMGHHQHMHPPHPQQAIPMPYHGDEFDGEPYYVAENQGEHYIYVTYPPELKRRLMERLETTHTTWNYVYPITEHPTNQSTNRTSICLALSLTPPLMVIVATFFVGTHCSCSFWPLFFPTLYNMAEAEVA